MAWVSVNIPIYDKTWTNIVYTYNWRSEYKVQDIINSLAYFWINKLSCSLLWEPLDATLDIDSIPCYTAWWGWILYDVTTEIPVIPNYNKLVSNIKWYINWKERGVFYEKNPSINIEQTIWTPYRLQDYSYMDIYFLLIPDTSAKIYTIWIQQDSLLNMFSWIFWNDVWLKIIDSILDNWNNYINSNVKIAIVWISEYWVWAADYSDFLIKAIEAVDATNPYWLSSNDITHIITIAYNEKTGEIIKWHINSLSEDPYFKWYAFKDINCLFIFCNISS